MMMCSTMRKYCRCQHRTCTVHPAGIVAIFGR